MTALRSFIKKISLHTNEIADEPINSIGLTPLEQFTTIHNYIDTDTIILRKGQSDPHEGTINEPSRSEAQSYHV